MKKAKYSILGISTILATLLAFSFAAGRYGQGMGQRMNAGVNQAQCVDTNNNGICDGQEDWDGDGIPNKDDPDYEKQYVNAREDGQLQQNRYQGQAETGQRIRAQMGSGMMGSGVRAMNQVRQNMQNMKQQFERVRQRLGGLADKIDVVLQKFFERISTLPVEEQIAKLQTILDKINAVYQKLNSIQDENKKELLKNVLDYLKLTIEAKLAELQGQIDEDATDILNEIFE